MEVSLPRECELSGRAGTLWRLFGLVPRSRRRSCFSPALIGPGGRRSVVGCRFAACSLRFARRKPASVIEPAGDEASNIRGDITLQLPPTSCWRKLLSPGRTGLSPGPSADSRQREASFPTEICRTEPSSNWNTISISTAHLPAVPRPIRRSKSSKNSTSRFACTASFNSVVLTGTHRPRSSSNPYHDTVALLMAEPPARDFDGPHDSAFENSKKAARQQTNALGVIN